MTPKSLDAINAKKSLRAKVKASTCLCVESVPAILFMRLAVNGIFDNFSCRKNKMQKVQNEEPHSQDEKGRKSCAKLRKNQRIEQFHPEWTATTLTARRTPQWMNSMNEFPVLLNFKLETIMNFLKSLLTSPYKRLWRLDSDLQEKAEKKEN